jgi:Ala-tRNA(Pro) deacylase
MISESEIALFSLFKKLGIETETLEHPAIFTVEEGAKFRKNMPGGHTKNLFLKDKAGSFALICALNDTQIQLNQTHKPLAMKRFSFGKPEALLDLLGVRPGSVTLFSILNDTECQVRLVLDKALFSQNRVWFHPLRNTASTAIYSSDIEAFAIATGHSPTIIDFTKV